MIPMRLEMRGGAASKRHLRGYHMLGRLPPVQCRRELDGVMKASAAQVLAIRKPAGTYGLSLTSEGVLPSRGGLDLVGDPPLMST